MFYREAGQFKTSYSGDQAVFPIVQDRWFIALVLIIAYVVIPAIANEYWFQAVFIPLFIFSLAAIGLNILTGYAGQLSLGTGAFMAVGGLRYLQVNDNFPRIEYYHCVLNGRVCICICRYVVWTSQSSYQGILFSCCNIGGSIFYIMAVQ